MRRVRSSAAADSRVPSVAAEMSVEAGAKMSAGAKMGAGAKMSAGVRSSVAVSPVRVCCYHSGWFVSSEAVVACCRFGV